MQKNFDGKLLGLVHHLLSGVKAYAAEFEYTALDEMRQCCGGAGFLKSSGIAQNWADAAPTTTYEGVSVIMYQQAARYIFGQLKSLSKDELTNGLFTYMNDMPMLLKSKCEAKTVAEFTKIANLNRVLAARAAFYITQTTAKI